MSRAKFVLLAAISIAVAFTFTSCGDDVDSDDNSSKKSSSSGGGSSGGGGSSSSIIPEEPSCQEEFDPFTQFCWGPNVYDLCGGEKYDPNIRFCYENKFYLKCGGLEWPAYNPLIQFCANDTLYLRCNGKERDPNNEFCFDGKTVVPKCGGEIFNPDEQFCLENELTHKFELIKKCGGNEYLPSEQFCHTNAKLYNKCEDGGDFKTNTDSLYGRYDIKTKSCCSKKETFTIATDFCFEQEKKAYPKCVGETYSPAYEFCYESEEIKPKCGDSTYTALRKQFCFQDKFYDLCGVKEYNPLTHFCNPADSIPYAKCNGKESNPKEQFCVDGKIVVKCGGNDYNPDDKFCFKRAHLALSDTIVDKCDGNEYLYSTEFCDGGKIYPRCAGEGNIPKKDREYNPFDYSCCGGVTLKNATHFCYEGETTLKCNGETYDITKEFCGTDRSDPTKKKSYPLCAGEEYTVADKFCFGNKFYLLCGIEEYNPLTHFCHPGADGEYSNGSTSDDKAYLRCGGNDRDTPEREFCFDGKILLMCGNEAPYKEYNPDEQECVGGELRRKIKCGGSDILPTEFCKAGKIYPKCGTAADGEYDIEKAACCGANTYTIATQFCSEEDGGSHNLCDGKTYNPLNYRCYVNPNNNKEQIINQILCNGEPYNRSKKFCYGNKLYDLCGGDDGKEYNPSTQFCSTTSTPIDTLSRCGGKEYDPNSEFCHDNKIARKCNGNRYNLETHFCYENNSGVETPEPKCNGEQYNVNTQFCEAHKIYPKCGTAPDGKYDVKTKICCGDTPITREGEGATQFCFEGAPWDKCNGTNGRIEYNPSIEFCKLGNIYPICGGNDSYDVLTRFCYDNNKLYDKCGGQNYNPVQEFCNTDPATGLKRPYLRCGGKAADPVKEFCDYNAGKIYERCNTPQGLKEYNPDEEFCLLDYVFDNTIGNYTYIYKIEPLCRGLTFNSKQFCRDFKIMDKCNNIIPLPAQTCIEDELYNRCGVIDLCKDDEPGCNSTNCSNTSTKYQKCGTRAYQIAENFCHNDNLIIKRCGGTNGASYDPDKEFCSDRDKVVKLCYTRTGPNEFGVYTYKYETYDTDKRECDIGNFRLIDKGSSQVCNRVGKYYYENDNNNTPRDTNDYFCCFGQIYQKDGNYFCYQNELYPECNRSNLWDPVRKRWAIGNVVLEGPYNPRDSICYNGSLKPYCLRDGITGPCAQDNGLLRCKQLGNGSNYVRDPLPGMECRNDGAIISTLGGSIELSVGYPLAQIGTQIWTAKNLELQYDASSNPTGKCYNDDVDYCIGENTIPIPSYGALYDWATAMSLAASCNSSDAGACSPPSRDANGILLRGICPPGFALPTDNDWDILAKYAGGGGENYKKIAAGRLKSTTDWANNGKGTDNYGFNAKPGGYEVYNGLYFEQGTGSIWWTRSHNFGDGAFYIYMISNDSELRTHHRLKTGGAYVRCVREAAF